jgi:hypothetical protein
MRTVHESDLRFELAVQAALVHLRVWANDADPQDMTQSDASLQLTCSAPHHKGPREMPRGWFRKSGKGRRLSWCRLCMRGLDAANRARRLSAGVGRVSAAIAQTLWDEQHGECACGCGRSLVNGFHVDHKVPIARGGRHDDGNLCLLTPRCNLRKGKRYTVPPETP